MVLFQLVLTQALICCSASSGAAESRVEKTTEVETSLRGLVQAENVRQIFLVPPIHYADPGCASGCAHRAARIRAARIGLRRVIALSALRLPNCGRPRVAAAAPPYRLVPTELPTSCYRAPCRAIEACAPID